MEQLRISVRNLTHLVDDTLSISQLDSFTYDVNLQKVLAQYLSNACKYTERGTITLSCTRLPGGTVEFAVADTGCGIDPCNAEIVFERFEKLGSYKQGNGLGLSIVRVIARLLHGVAYLDTAYQEGARFVFRLPGDSIA